MIANVKAKLLGDPDNPPPMPSVNVDGIPDELKQLEQWVNWRWTWTPGKGKWDKPPCTPTGRAASSTDRKTWSSFEHAIAATLNPQFGIGIVFAKEGGLVGIDLDGVIDPETGELGDWPERHKLWHADAPGPAELVEMLGSYTERSPSGTGLKIIVRGRLNLGASNQATSRRRDPIEVYSWGRFFTITGDTWRDFGDLRENQAGLDELVRLFLAEPEKPERPAPRARPAASATLGRDPQEILRRAFAASNGDKIRRLYDGDWSGYASQSDADLALCSMLAFWCGDAETLDALFRGSGLYREKWDELRGGRTYGERTVERALDGSEFYDWDRPLSNTNGSHSGAAKQATAPTNGSVPKPTEPEPPRLNVRVRGLKGTWSLVEDRDGLATVQQTVDGAVNLQRVASELVRYPGPQPFLLEPVRFEKLMEMEFSTRFLVKRVLVERQPCIIGGPSKTLKTSLTLDLALSLASGTPFLGEFNCEPADVLFLSAESGAQRIQMLARAIARAKGLGTEALPLWFEWRLPKIASDHDLAEVERVVEDIIRRQRPVVLIIDPIYLAMSSATGEPINMGNLVEVGAVLGRITELCDAAGITCIILHHVSKGAARAKRGTDEPMELEDLSQSGFAEWARQWLLLSRRTPYVQGSGRHELYVNVGGSMGHSGLYAADIDEGVIDDEFRGTRWDVTVQSAVDAREEAKQRKRAAAEKREHEKKQEMADAIERAFLSLPGHRGTRNQIAERSGKRGNAKFDEMLAEMIRKGWVQTCMVKRDRRPEEEGYEWVRNDRSD